MIISVQPELCEITLVIPFFNESDNVDFVISEIFEKLPEIKIIAVDDGSSDNTLEKLRAFDGIHIIPLIQNCGQSTAMLAGLAQVETSWAATIDGDGQNNPDDLNTMIAAMKPNSVLCGRRMNRKDSVSKRITSKLGNWIRNLVLKDGVHDTGCSLKLFPKEAIISIPPFNGVHRFLPAFWKNAGFEIIEVKVSHRPRYLGVSKYNNLGRAKRGLWDIIGVSWLLQRRIFPVKSIDYERRNPCPTTF
mgnify:CR=1 FL=1